MDERLTELETKVMFQDQTIEELNQVVYAQQQEIDRLAEELRLLKQRFAMLHRLLSGGEDGPTPEGPPSAP